MQGCPMPDQRPVTVTVGAAGKPWAGTTRWIADCSAWDCSAWDYSGWGLGSDGVDAAPDPSAGASTGT